MPVPQTTPPAPGRTGVSRRQRAARLARGLGLTLLLALACNLLLEVGRAAAADGDLWVYKTPSFAALFVLGTLVLWLLVGLIHAVVGRLRWTVVVALPATTALVLADARKVALRREPVYPDDWRFLSDPGFLAQIVGVPALLGLGAVVLVVGVVTALAARRAGRPAVPDAGVPAAPAASRAGRLALRVATVALALPALAHLADFNEPGNAVRGTYEAFGAKWLPWSQQRNYLGNGFVGGFLYNMDVPAMSRPPGYGPAVMARIATTYTREAARINAARTGGPLDDVNVVMVLSESFSDPRALRGVQTSQDPIPFTRRLMERTTSGTMLAQNIGGGTANMEFEALTGMSMSQFPPQTRVPYQMVIPDRDTFPSAVGWMQRQGHRTVAIHPFTTEMYRRSEVYPVLGFDEFVDQSELDHAARIGADAYISDAAAFDEVLRQLEDSEAPVFAHLVTMQNHIPYAGRYRDPLEATAPDGAAMPGISQYARGLAHSDRALERLVTRLEASEEDTVLVFYGDHLPGVYPPSVFAANDPRTMRQTPFLVWDNLGRQPRTPLPATLSPIHFLGLVLEQTDTPVPPYYALLQRLRERVPAMDSGLYVDAHDRSVALPDLSPAAREVLHDYRLVQYDLAVGRGYAAEALLDALPVPGPAAGRVARARGE